MTAVQWLIDQLQAPCRGIPNHIIDEALKMQSDQILQSHVRGYRKGWEDANDELQKYVDSVCNKYSFLKK